MTDCGFWERGMDEYMSSLRKKAYEKRLPFKGVLELTPRCNFKCNMCYVHLKPEEIPGVGTELSGAEWVAIARRLQQAGTMELTITGGEPFVRKDFRKIYEAIHDMGFLIQIFSNGSLLDEETAEWLKRRPPRAVRFTLYGACDETYRKVCGAEDGFSRVKKSIEILKAVGIPLYLCATVTRENEHELGEMYRFAAEQGVPMIHTADLINPVRGATADAKSHQAERRLPPPEVIRSIRKQEKGKYPRKPCRDFLQLCGNYRTGFWITWNGMLQLCAFLTEPSVDVRDTDFMESWQQLQEKVDELRQPEECGNCRYERYCERCPGLLYAENGGCGRISREFCKKAEFRYLLFEKEISEED